MEISANDYLQVNFDHPSLDSSVWLEFTQDKSLMEKKIFLEN
jgi:hypothetical protein